MLLLQEDPTAKQAFDHLGGAEGMTGGTPVSFLNYECSPQEDPVTKPALTT